MSAIKRSLNVGVVGLGNMGLPIARNIAFKARSSIYLQLHSRDRQKLRTISDNMQVDGATCGIRLHHEYHTVTKWCDIILLCLKDQAAAEEVLLARDGDALLPNARPGQIIVDHTTTDVHFARHCAAAAARQDAVYLDAPLSGSPRQAFNNQLVVMVGGGYQQAGGPQSTSSSGSNMVQRLTPIFNMYCDHIYNMGDSGAGQGGKLLSTMLMAAHNSAAAEAMQIAQKLHLEFDPAASHQLRQGGRPGASATFMNEANLLKVLDASWGSSTMLRRNAPTMQDLLRNPDRVPPTSGLTIDHLLQDLSYLDSSLHREGAEGEQEEEEEEEAYPVLDASLRMLGAAQEANMGDRDIAAVVHYVQAAAAALTPEQQGQQQQQQQPVAALEQSSTQPNAAKGAKATPTSIHETTDFEGDFY